MQVLTDIRDYALGPSVLVMGKFDGVHLGHARLMDEAVQLARASGATSVALTFDRHPLSVLAPERAPAQLITLEQKVERIRARGIEVLIVSAFTPEISQREAGVYLGELCEMLHPQAIVCGPSYSFGRGALGNADLIERMADTLGYTAVIVEPLLLDGETVSSSAIRAWMQTDIGRAERMLGRPIR